MTWKRVTWLAVRWLFFLLSMVYLAFYVRQILSEHQGFTWPSPRTFGFTAIAALVFSSTAAFSGLGWHILLRHLGYQRSFLMVARVLFLTQIGKYLPGNVGHHVGRVALARSVLGVPVTAAVASLAQESALVALAALLVGGACYGLYPHLNLPAAYFGVDIRLAFFAVVGTGLAILAVMNLLRAEHVQIRSRMVNWALRAAPSWRATASAMPGFLIIYLLNGLAVAIVATALFPLEYKDLALLTAAYSLSWVLGFLVPGAPGGLGVREASLLFLLNGAYAGDVILAIAFLARIATVLADFIIFSSGLALRRTAAV